MLTTTNTTTLPVRQNSCLHTCACWCGLNYLNENFFRLDCVTAKPLSNSAFRASATLQDCSSCLSLTLIGSCHSFWYQVTLQRHCWHMKMIVFLFWFCNCGNGPNTRGSSRLNMAILQLGTQHSHMTKRQRGPTLCYCSSPSS